MSIEDHDWCEEYVSEAPDTSSPEPDRALCEGCKVELPSERVFARRCLDCADTEEFDSDPFGYGGTD